MSPKKKRLLIPLNNPRTPGPGKRAFIFALRAILIPISFVLGGLYRLCFGWLDKRGYTKLDEKFAEDIKTNLSFLFRERHAHIVSNEGRKLRRAFDSSYVTLAADTLLFRFTRCRGDFGVEVASEADPDQFEYLHLVLETALCPPESRQAIWESCQYLRTLPRVLQPHFDTLKTVLSKEQHSGTLEKATQTHNERIDQQVAELRARGINPRVL